MTPLRLLFTRSVRGKLALALLPLILAILPGCSQQRKPVEEEKKPSPVAQNGPKLEPIRPVTPMPVRERVPSQGDCAPRYKVGGTGTCINNQPCRGFGVKASNGSAVCTCFGRDGGCGEGQRCDARRLACVPETEPLSSRGD